MNVNMSLKELAATAHGLLGILGPHVMESYSELALSVKHNPALRDTLSETVLLMDRSVKDFRTGRIEEAYIEMLHHFHSLARWSEYGYNTFDLTHSLAAGLLLTEPPPFNPDEFKLPFPSLCIRIPEGIVPVWLGEGKQVWARHLWVHLYTALDKDTDKAIPWFHFIARTDGVFDVWRQRPVHELFSGDYVEEKFVSYSPRDPPQMTEDETTYHTGMRVICNLLSWLSATGGLESRSPHNVIPVKKGKKKEADELRPKVWILGQEVKLSKELREAAIDIALGSRNKRQDWRVRVRFIVRGHWRNQAHGPERSLRRRQWIEPFWKGPTDGASWAHLYKPVGDLKNVRDEADVRSGK